VCERVRESKCVRERECVCVQDDEWKTKRTREE
jgi:hypothetical protein